MVADVKEALRVAVKLYSFKTLGPFSAASTMTTTKKFSSFILYEKIGNAIARLKVQEAGKCRSIEQGR